MDIEKLLTILPLYFSDYFSAFFQTLQKPTSRFQPVTLTQTKREIISSPSLKSHNHLISLNPKLISFIVLSIFIGSVIQSVTPNRPPLHELPNLIIFVVITWLLISSIIYFFFKVVGGKGGFFDSISISLQLIAVIHVIASLASLVISIVFSLSSVDVGTPFTFYITSQFILFFAYLPPALKNLHFGSSRKERLALVLATTLSILAILLISFACGILNIYTFFML